MKECWDHCYIVSSHSGHRWCPRDPDDPKAVAGTLPAPSLGPQSPSPTQDWQVRTGVTHGGAGWAHSRHKDQDELSYFAGATELTVNIRGNDIDFKVLWFQMSLVLAFSFSLLRKNSLPDLICIFPSSASLFLEQGGWTQVCPLHLLGLEDRGVEACMSCPSPVLRASFPR